MPSRRGGQGRLPDVRSIVFPREPPNGGSLQQERRRQRFVGANHAVQQKGAREALLRWMSQARPGPGQVLVRHDPEWDGGESDAARPVSVFFSRDRGMVFFLAFLVLTTTILPMISLSRLGRLAVSMAFGLTTVLGAFATIRHRTAIFLV